MNMIANREIKEDAILYSNEKPACNKYKLETHTSTNDHKAFVYHGKAKVLTVPNDCRVKLPSRRSSA